MACLGGEPYLGEKTQLPVVSPAPLEEAFGSEAGGKVRAKKRGRALTLHLNSKIQRNGGGNRQKQIPWERGIEAQGKAKGVGRVDFGVLRCTTFQGHPSA